MKNLLLVVLVAISTMVYSQDVDVPNFKFKTKSNRTLIMTGFNHTDSTWFAYDSSNMLVRDYSNKIYYGDELVDTTTGYYSYKQEEIIKTIGFDKRYETFSFDFDEMIFVRHTLFSREKSKISWVMELYNGDGVFDGEYYIDVITEDGYDRQYYVNIKKRTLYYKVNTTLEDIPEDSFFYDKRKSYIADGVIVKPRKN